VKHYQIEQIYITDTLLWQNSPMDLKQIEYFVRVAEMGSFTRAAIALNVAQPALSRQIRLLEVELRHNLLKRNGRGASPTEAGLLLLEHGRGILHQVERAHEELGRARSGLTGRVALGLPPSVARVLTVPLTRAFREKMPEAQMSISEGLTTAMQESLLNGRLDIALLYNMKATSGLEISHLVQEELWLVQKRPPGLQEDPPPPPIDLKDVAKLPLVIPSRPNAIRMHVESEMAALGTLPQIALEIDGVTAILDLVADGAGCAILSRNAVTRSINPSAFSTRPISHPQLSIELSCVVSSQRPSTLTQQATLSLIRETALRLLESV
jgi:LysR family nitrogen assimilation transcriptional regulator